MTKKIIAVLIVVTVLFVCVFAACQKNDDESVYSDGKDLNLVTDENGEKVLAENGQLLVYATDEEGKYVKDKDGERVTYAQNFQPIEEDGVIEDYGFKIALPDGWETTNKFGIFTNEDKHQSCEITIVKYLYQDYYDLCYQNYELLVDEGIDCKWEDDVELGKDFGKAARFIVTQNEGVLVVGFFENSGNVYKIYFMSGEKENVTEDFDAFCKAMDFKPFAYYDDITAVSKEEITK